MNLQQSILLALTVYFLLIYSALYTWHILTFFNVRCQPQNLLRGIGAKCNSRSKIECFTEIAFKEDYGIKQTDIPDGLIVITTGKTIWRALVEVKVDSNKLEKEQIDNYLMLAKKHDIQAVVTISNQYVTQQNLQPSSLKSLAGTKKVKDKLFHWSWGLLLNNALIWVNDHKKEDRDISDIEQRYILQEFVRFCTDSASGIDYKYGNMGSDWQNTCRNLQDGTKCPPEEISNAVSSWHKLMRSLTLQLGMTLKEHINVWINNKHKKNPEDRLKDNIKQIKDNSQFIEYLVIPNTSSTLDITVDIRSRTVCFSMTVMATQNRETAKGVVNDFLHMIKSEDDSLIIHALMGRKQNIETTMKEIKASKGTVIYKECHSLPQKFKVTKIIHIGKTTFNSPRSKFPEEIFIELKKYYDDVGQYLCNRTPSAPKMSKDINNKNDTEESNIE